MSIWMAMIWAKFYCLRAMFPEDCEIGDWLKVFLYFDSEDLLIATTEDPQG